MLIGGIWVSMMVCVGSASACLQSCVCFVSAGLLNGEVVEYRKKEHQLAGGMPLANGGSVCSLQGVLTGNGGVLCGCRECQGIQDVPPSVFEEHAGSTARRPSEFIFLRRFNYSLKVCQECTQLFAQHSSTATSAADTWSAQWNAVLCRCYLCSTPTIPLW